MPRLTEEQEQHLAYQVETAEHYIKLRVHEQIGVMVERNTLLAIAAERQALLAFFTARQSLERALSVAARCRRGGASPERQQAADEAVAVAMRAVEKATKEVEGCQF